MDCSQINTFVGCLDVMRLHELFLKRRSTRFDFGDMLINLLHVKLKFDEYQICMCINDVGIAPYDQGLGHWHLRSRLGCAHRVSASQYDSRTLMLQ